jgi:hypothetical protein
MAQTIKLKRSAVAGKVPTTSDLALGEVGTDYLSNTSSINGGSF